MNAGNAKALAKTLQSRTVKSTMLGLLMGTCIVLGALPVLAQTPDTACAADSLYLISPDEISTQSQTEGRPGMIITWPDISLDDATCYTLTETEDLDFSVMVDGGFGDQVDRFITFSIADGSGGSIAHNSSSQLLMNWQSQGAAEYGVLAGTINLANNGGIQHKDLATGAISLLNNGLPMSWLQVNVLALDSGTSGFMVAGLSGGETLETQVKGLWAYRGGMWTRLSPETFGGDNRVTAVAVSSVSNDIFAVGTARNGLYLTTDGGQSFTNYMSELDLTAPEPPSVFAVSALDFHAGRLLVFVQNFGLFITEDDGQSFTRSPLLVEDNLDLDEPELVLPQLYDIFVDPANNDRILVGLRSNGVWESTDGGASWHDLYGDLNVSDPDEAGSWQYSALSVGIDSGAPGTIVAMMRQKGFYRSADGGSTWTRVGEDQDPENINLLGAGAVVPVAGEAGRFLMQVSGHKLLESLDGGLTWAEAPEQPFVPGGDKVVLTEDGHLLIGTIGGGVFEADSTIYLSDTYNSTTSGYLRDLDLGLDITFGNGAAPEGASFNLVAQTFQGWAVWRAPGYDPEDLTLLGLYDRVNPESCIEGYCGDESYDLVPQCYISKRAACFHFTPAPEGSGEPGTISFFDDEVYNGFSYFYAVSTFDYGNTALVSPENNTNTMLFSPRYEDDELSPFIGDGNTTFVQVNSPTTDPVRDDPIYVYPNPLRRDEGIPGQEGKTVVFTNLPPESRVRIFTTAGDDVINLGWDNMRDGNIYWQTNNRDGEDVSPGVYLYKVESPQREEYWGRLVIIR
jgi:photosystem II stability/assembly factor-like uncharacterized protein